MCDEKGMEQKITITNLSHLAALTRSLSLLSTLEHNISSVIFVL